MATAIKPMKAMAISILRLTTRTENGIRCATCSCARVRLGWNARSMGKDNMDMVRLSSRGARSRPLQNDDAHDTCIHGARHLEDPEHMNAGEARRGSRKI